MTKSELVLRMRSPEWPGVAGLVLGSVLVVVGLIGSCGGATTELERAALVGQYEGLPCEAQMPDGSVASCNDVTLRFWSEQVIEGMRFADEVVLDADAGTLQVRFASGLGAGSLTFLRVSVDWSSGQPVIVLEVIGREPIVVGASSSAEAETIDTLEGSGEPVPGGGSPDEGTEPGTSEGTGER